MRRNLLLLLLLGCIAAINAQNLNYDISKYKLPDTKRQQLDFNFGLGSSNEFSETESLMYSNGEKRTSNGFGNNFKIDYSSFKNTRKLQTITQGGLYNQYTFGKSKRGESLEDSYAKNSYFTPRVYFSRVHRTYTNSNNFIELNTNTNLNYSGMSSDSENDFSTSNNSSKTLEYNLFIPVKYGSGRIEEVQDARQAVYILDELYKANRITGDISEEQITEFADLIATLKAERFFDSRIQKISELSRIDSFLHKNALLSNNDITYFATLNDFWDYGRQQVRRSGTRTSAVLYPGFGLLKLNEDMSTKYNDDTREDYEETTDLNITSISINTGIEVNYEKPVSLNKQMGTDFALLAGFVQSAEKDSDGKLKIPNVQIDFEQRFGYFPNTRTALNWMFGVSAMKTFDLTKSSDDDFGIETLGADLKTGLSYNYYISPQFRLNASWNVTYSWNDDENDMIGFNNFDFFNAKTLNQQFSQSMSYSPTIYKNRLNNYINISLVYSLF